MKKLLYIPTIILLFLLSSCNDNYIIRKGNYMAYVEEVKCNSSINYPNPELTLYRTNKCFKSYLHVDGSDIVIMPTDSKYSIKINYLDDLGHIYTPSLGTSFDSPKNKFFFNYNSVQIDSIFNAKKNKSKAHGSSRPTEYILRASNSECSGNVPFTKIPERNYKSLRYLSIRPSFGPITIPLKLRPEVQDSLPTQASTGFNAALSGGIQLIMHRAKSSLAKQRAGEKATISNPTFSLQLTGFLGLGATEINSGNSLLPTSEKTRNTPVISMGPALIFGVKRLNLGYGVGFDFATGEYASNWVYQGKLWHGFLIGLDLLK